MPLSTNKHNFNLTTRPATPLPIHFHRKLSVAFLVVVGLLITTLLSSNPEKRQSDIWAASTVASGQSVPNQLGQPSEAGQIPPSRTAFDYLAASRSGVRQDVHGYQLDSYLTAGSDNLTELEHWDAAAHPHAQLGNLAEPALAATRVSEEGLQKIMDWEGFSLRGYLLGDGKCTIGWGHAVAVRLRPNCRNWVITEAEAREKLQADVARFEDAVNNFFTRDFNQNQFDAVVSFAFNVGQVWYRWQWPTDPDDEFFNRVLPKYIYPVQFRNGLMRRRAAEVYLFNTPIES